MRRRVVGLALGIALVGGAGVAAVTRAPRDTASLSAAPAAAPAAPSPSASALPSPAATPTPTPSPTRTAVPSPPPDDEAPPDFTPPPPPPGYKPPVLTDHHPVFGGVPTGTAQYPYTAGQRSWTVTQHGITVVIALSSGVRTGEPATWRFRASGVSPCCSLSILYGDGYDAIVDEAPGGAVALRHTYNRAGRHAFAVQVGGTGWVRGSVSMTGWFDVGPGPTSAQGPEPVHVEFDSSAPLEDHPADPRYVTLWGMANDPDGRIAKLVVAFGDGTTTTFAGDPNPCRRSLDGWPLESHAWLPHDPEPLAYHYYAAPGTYTLTLTAYSTGCDGTSDVQTEKASFTWYVPETAFS